MHVCNVCKQVMVLVGLVMFRVLVVRLSNIIRITMGFNANLVQCCCERSKGVA